MSDEVAISVQNVSKDFVLPHEKSNSLKSLLLNVVKRRNRSKETQHALEDISFDIKKGEFFGIVGRNGSGKSTLLKILAGIYQPNSGRIVTKGKLVPFIELGVGFNPELSGRDNVFLNGAMLGFSQKEVAAMYDDIVSFAELEEFMDQKLKNYSSGMQVRLAFSMAVRADADILLIDEVLAVGDADFQRKCFEYFNQLKRRKKTVVFVSHDMDAVQKYCDRTMVIDKHKTIHLGDTVEAAEKYLQLFNKTVAGKEGAEEGVKRWGDGSFRTTDISVKVANSSVTVSHKAKLFSEAASLTAGIRVRSSTGQPVTGTSTQLESVTIPDLKVGEEVEITWKMPNIFSDGQYYVDPALASDGGITITDWWDQAARFTVKKKRPLPYQVDPDFDIEVKRK